MDFVFGKTIPSLPVSTAVVIGGLPPIEMRTASPEQSLAWKLMWLQSDCYPMGKDLYDAVLLAESYPVTADLIAATFATNTDSYSRSLKNLTRQNVLNWHLEWDDFIQEYPHVVGSVEEWKQRLASALGPLFEDLERYSAKWICPGAGLIFRRHHRHLRHGDDVGENAVK